MASNEDRRGGELNPTPEQPEVVLEQEQSRRLRVRQLLDGLGPSIFAGLLTPGGVLIDANRSALAATGLRPENVLGKCIDQIAPWTNSPEGATRLRESLDRAALGESCRYDAQLNAGAGEPIDIDFSLEPLRDETGRVTLIVASASVITQRKQVERRLERLNRIYAVLSDINQRALREPDQQALLKAVCRIAVERGQFCMAWTGLKDDSTGTLRVAAHAGATDDTVQLLRLLVEGQRPDCLFTFHALQTGEHSVCNDIAHDSRAAMWRHLALERGYRAIASLPLMDQDRVIGTLNLYAGQARAFDEAELQLLDQLARDLSFALGVQRRENERRDVERALRESEHRFRELAENIHEVFWMTDARMGEVLYASPAYERIWGRSCASLIGSSSGWIHAVHPDDLARVLRTLESGLASGEYEATYRILRPDGSIRWIHDRAVPVRDAGGDLQRVVGTAVDVTEQRQLEERLRESQRLEAIGRLAGGVAHDFNNILAIIKGYGGLLTMDGQLAGESAAAATQIIQAADRAANLTRQLLAFSQRQVMQPRLGDLNDIVRSLVPTLDRLAGENIRLVPELHAEPLVIRADAGMLEQALVNLIANARDSMPGGGQIVLATRPRLMAREEARQTARHEAGSYACVRVSDTGCGIPQQNLAHIYEPFFTTKEHGKGSGLGLATVFGIVTQLAGRIEVISEVGRGTSFEICLPVTELEMEADANAQASDSTGGAVEQVAGRGKERILIVEDSRDVRRLTRIVLERAGYRVFEAANAAEALSIWEQQQHAIELLLTDVAMPPGVSGHELAAQLQSSRPGLRVIFTSGYSADDAGREPSLQPGQNFVPKPCSPRQLLEVVRRSLDR